MSRDITVYEKGYTATDDNPFQVDNEPSNILSSVNIHCYDNDVYYGTAAFQLGVIPANSVVWFDGIIRVSEFWFKNYTPGSNAQVVVAGIIKR